MSKVWFTSDQHLGSKFIAKTRGFASVEEHDDCILSRLRESVTKKDVLLVLGDITNNEESLMKLNTIPCLWKMMVFGNHDGLGLPVYQKVFGNNIHGFYKAYGFWISHAPIHSQEMIGTFGNIHGHIHKSGCTNDLGFPWFNVNVDYNDYYPVELHSIRKVLNYKFPYPESVHRE